MLNQEAMHNFVREMLHDSPAAQRMLALWQVHCTLPSPPLDI